MTDTTDMAAVHRPVEAERSVAAHCSIRRWATGDRPREKMLTGHPGVLTDSELLAILIGSGSARVAAVELSRQMLSAFGGNLHLMADRSAKELCGRFKGIGEAKAASILAPWSWAGGCRSARCPFAPKSSPAATPSCSCAPIWCGGPTRCSRCCS